MTKQQAIQVLDKLIKAGIFDLDLEMTLQEIGKCIEDNKWEEDVQV